MSEHLHQNHIICRIGVHQGKAGCMAKQVHLGGSVLAAPKDGLGTESMVKTNQDGFIVYN